jgi:hypothetical protein
MTNAWPATTGKSRYHLGTLYGLIGTVYLQDLESVVVGNVVIH